MKLAIQSGPDAGREISLTKGRMTIGRMPGSDILLKDELVSRRHAEIRRQDNQFVITDLDSRNGTRVNGVRISGPHVLQPGDELRVGSTTILFQGRAEPPAIRDDKPVAPAYPAQIRPKDPGLAALLEVLFGLFGFLGLGWIYAGNVTRGILTLVGYWLLLALFIIVATATLGLASCLILPLNLSIIAFSAISVHRYVGEMNEAYA